MREVKSAINLFTLSYAVTCLCALLFFVLAFGSAKENAITSDETAHIPGGYMIWKTGDYRMNIEHPPLVKMWAALPLLLYDFYSPIQDVDWKRGDEWHFGGYFLFYFNDALLIAMLSRFQIIMLGILLGLMVYIWGARLFAASRNVRLPIAGLFAAIFYFSEPNLIAHSALVTYDIAFALVVFAAGYVYWLLHMEGFTKKRLTFFIFLMALAPLVKVVGLFLWALIFLHWGASTLFSRRRWRASLPGAPSGILASRWSKAKVVIASMILCSALCFLLIWNFYGFRYYASPGYEKPPGDQADKYLEYSKISSPILRGTLNILKDYKILPQGYLCVLGHAFLEKERPAVLLKKVRMAGGFYSYFIFTTLLKTPFIHLAAMAAAAAYFIWLAAQSMARRHWKHFSRTRFYLHRAAIPIYLAIGFFIIITMSLMNIGHRLILMIVPLQCLLMGNVLECFLSRLEKPASRRALGVIMMLAAFAPAVLNYPHYISYFNPIIGERRMRGRYLADSNVDWGQDLKALGDFMKRNGIAKVNLSYFGTADPWYYGVNRWIDIGSWQILIPRLKQDKPDYTVPTAVSANMIGYVADKHPELLRSGEPLLIGGSILLFPPVTRESQ